MLTCLYINPLIQFGEKSYHLRILDEAGAEVARYMPTFPEAVTEAEMADYAANMMSVTEAALALSQQEAQP